MKELAWRVLRLPPGETYTVCVPELHLTAVPYLLAWRSLALSLTANSI
jgi:hypothetical protein